MKATQNVTVKILDFTFDLNKIRDEIDKMSDNYLPKLRLMKNWMGVPLRNFNGSTTYEGLELSKSVDFTNFKIAPCQNTSILENMPYTKTVIEKISNEFETEIGLVRIFKIPAHQSVAVHQDGIMFNFDKISVYRLHLPIYSNNQTVFMINNNNYYLAPNHLYFTDVSYPHSVTNSSDQDRIHIVIDIQATHQIHDMIKKCVDLKPINL